MKPTSFKQILPKDFTFFSKIVELSSKFQKFWYQIDKIGPTLVPILEKIENMTQVYISFCTKGVIIITGGWFCNPFQLHVPG